VAVKGDQSLHLKHYFLYGAALGILTGVLAYFTRPARLRSAGVTAVAPSTPPVASIALRYGHGLPPISVIVDVQGRGGNGGSATIDGLQRFVEIPIVGPPDDSYRVTATVTYQLLGRLWTRISEFGMGD
jgi:hypothetical protein